MSAALLAALTVVGCGTARPTRSPSAPPITFSSGSRLPTTTLAQTTSRPTVGPQGVELQTGQFLAPATATVAGRPVRGILCQSLPQLAYRRYIHLRIYVRGRSRAIPGGVGMVTPQPHVHAGGLIYTASACYYWLHTRAADGLILLESPAQRPFTLRDFFAIWNQPLSRDSVGPYHGRVTVRVDGKLWKGAPGSVPLTQMSTIEMAVGKPTPRFHPTDWLAVGL